MAKKRDGGRIMDRVRARLEASGMTLNELGLRMGYPENSARKSAWQFMKTADPRVSMLERFANVVGMDVKDLI